MESLNELEVLKAYKKWRRQKDFAPSLSDYLEMRDLKKCVVCKRYHSSETMNDSSQCPECRDFCTPIDLKTAMLGIALKRLHGLAKKNAERTIVIEFAQGKLNLVGFDEIVKVVEIRFVNQIDVDTQMMVTDLPFTCTNVEIAAGDIFLLLESDEPIRRKILLKTYLKIEQLIGFETFGDFLNVCNLKRDGRGASYVRVRSSCLF